MRRNRLNRLRLIGWRLTVACLIAIWLCMVMALPSINVLHAQSGICTVLYDFTITPGPFGGTFGTWVEGTGYVSEFAYGGQRIALIQNSSYSFTALGVGVISSDYAYTTLQLYVNHDASFDGNWSLLSENDPPLDGSGGFYSAWSGTSVDGWPTISLFSTGAQFTLHYMYAPGECSPTPTPTPTFTPTPFPIGTPALLTVYPIQCGLLNSDTANFNNLPGAWTLTAGLGNPAGLSSGLYFDLGSATLKNLSLSPTHRYRIDLQYHMGPTTNEHFSVKLGANPSNSVFVTATSGEQTSSVLPQNYQPNRTGAGASLYDLVLTQPNSGQQLVVDNICLVDTSPAPSKGGFTAPSADSCKACTTPTDPLDIGGWIGWLGCGIDHFFNCFLASLLYGLWTTLVGFAQMLQWIGLWLALQTQAVFDWIGTTFIAVIDWLGGWLYNVILSTGAISFLQNTVNTISAIIAIIGQLFTNIVTIIGAVLSAIPILVYSIIVGVTSTNAIPSWAPSCTVNNSFFYGFCLASYVIDNTIFNGPFYLIVPGIMGFVSLLTVQWIMHKSRNAIGGSGSAA